MDGGHPGEEVGDGVLLGEQPPEDRRSAGGRVGDAPRSFAEPNGRRGRGVSVVLCRSGVQRRRRRRPTAVSPRHDRREGGGASRAERPVTRPDASAALNRGDAPGRQGRERRRASTARAREATRAFSETAAARLVRGEAGRRRARAAEAFWEAASLSAAAYLFPEKGELGLLGEQPPEDRRSAGGRVGDAPRSFAEPNGRRGRGVSVVLCRSGVQRRRRRRPTAVSPRHDRREGGGRPEQNAQ